VSERWARFLVRRRWAVLATIAALTIVIGAGIGRLRAESNVEASLPADHPYVVTDHAIRKQFGGRNAILIAVVPRTGDVWRPEVLQVVQDVTLAALRLPDIIATNVVSLAAPSVRHVEDAGGTIRVDYLMRDVPQTAEGIARLQARLDANPQLRGMLVSPTGSAALVIIDFWDAASGPELAERTLSLRAVVGDRPVDLYFAGEPLFALTDVEQSHQIARRFPITFLVIALMLLVSFRNLQGMLIPMLTATLSCVWCLGLMGWTGLVIDSWNATVPILLVAVAAAHSAQMLKRYTEDVVRLRDNRAAVISSTATMGPVMLAAGGVAAMGFASLGLVGVPAIRNFGLACTYGIASAILLELSFIPALRAILPAPRHVPHEGGLTARALGTLARVVMHDRGRTVLIATAVILLFAAVGILRIRTFGSPREYLATGSLQRTHLEVIERHFPGTVTMTILYKGPPGTSKTVAVLQHMDGLAAAIAADPLVWRTATLADLVKVLHQTFNPDDPTPYRIPDDQELVSQLMFLGDSPAFERFMDRAQTSALVLAYLRGDDATPMRALLERTRAWLRDHPPPKGVEVLVAGGGGPITLAVNEHTTYGKLLNMAVVLATIWLVSSIMLRSPRAGLFVVSPLAVTIVLLLGLLGWTGTRLDMGSASIIAIASGIGADYAIYFLYRLREERQRTSSDAEALTAAMQTSGRAIVFVATSIAAGFAVIGISQFLGLRLFGTLMPAAMLLSCLAALSVMPALVLRLRPRFVFGTPDRTRAAA
jgi:hypothetical protein